jgi:hypothetical protein
MYEKSGFMVFNATFNNISAISRRRRRRRKKKKNKKKKINATIKSHLQFK